MQKITVNTIGVKARSLITHPQGIWVMGATSAGIFIHLAEDWVIFLSPDRFRGPLTLNVARPVADLLIPLDPGWCGSGTIQFLEKNLIFDTSQAAVWQVPASSKDVLSGEQRSRYVNLLAKHISAAKSDGEIENLLYACIDPFSETPEYPNTIPQLVSDLRNAIQGQKQEVVIEVLIKLLGRGTGLTPVGDDLVCGLVLALSRWGALFSPWLSPATIGQAVVPMAYQHTTLLSANLIECAADGQADERLILSLDGIVTGSPSLENCLELLLTWGNTSGSAAFCGMAALITLSP